MIVEVLRLLITLVLTAVGYELGGTSDGTLFGAEFEIASARLFGAMLGAAVGYVIGGVSGRTFRQRMDTLPGRFLPSLSGPELFAGAFGVVVGLAVGAAVAWPVVVLAPPVIGWSTGLLVVVVLVTLSARLFALRSQDLMAMTGLRQRGPLVSRRLDGDERTYLVDSSAGIDGRLLDLARMGLVEGRVWIPAFVLDELQGLADAGEKSRRRRGRRGLDVLEALRDVPGLEVTVLEETVPEFEEVDAKLIALAVRSGSTLATTDTHLAKAAEIRGVRVLNPGALGESLKPVVEVGAVISVPVSKEGSGAKQGVGYLDDGSMVVVEEASGLIGSDVDVEITSTTKTAVGRMYFGRPA